MKKAGEGWAFSGLMRGQLEKDQDSTRKTGLRPRSLCIITIIPDRCKEKPLRPGREG